MEIIFKLNKLIIQLLAFIEALTKQKGPNVCWDARFFNPFWDRQLIKMLKKRFKNQASQQKFGHSYFVKALVRKLCYKGPKNVAHFLRLAVYTIV
jgi:hypothetical protein